MQDSGAASSSSSSAPAVPLLPIHVDLTGNEEEVAAGAEDTLPYEYENNLEEGQKDKLETWAYRTWMTWRHSEQHPTYAVLIGDDDSRGTDRSCSPRDLRPYFKNRQSLARSPYTDTDF